ncbi:MAG: hypothetical protein PHI96_00735 [Desulfovibrio sp.]|nr:hypothetical protein [Desulfovibrio sp.]
MSGGNLRLDDAIPGLEALDGVFELKVGVMEAATNGKGQNVAEYAAANEFGVPGKIPSRPAMGETLDANESKYAEGLGDLLMAGMNPEEALGQLGEKVTADMVKSISRWETPPNKQSTVKAKLRKTGGRVGNAPLYETGAYVGSISSEVNKV